VDLRRDFFRDTPAQVRGLLDQLRGNALLPYVDEPVALEWHQRQNEARPPPAPPEDGIGWGREGDVTTSVAPQ
jgi:hypothetical protein